MGNINEAIALALKPTTVPDMIKFLKTPFNQSEESTATAVRYFRHLAESQDPKAQQYISNFILSSF